jgi:CheY-like chemotaxis protein
MNRTPPSIIGCSAYEDEKERWKCIDSGMAGCITKPIDVAQLRIILKSYYF